MLRGAKISGFVQKRFCWPLLETIFIRPPSKPCAPPPCVVTRAQGVEADASLLIN
jgi:hypothetical protein